MDSQFLPPPQRGPAQPDRVTVVVQRITAPSSVYWHSTSLLFMAQTASRGFYTPQLLHNISLFSWMLSSNNTTTSKIKHFTSVGLRLKVSASGSKHGHKSITPFYSFNDLFSNTWMITFEVVARETYCISPWNLSPKTIMRLNIRLKGKSNRERCQLVGGGIRGALYGKCLYSYSSLLQNREREGRGE